MKKKKKKKEKKKTKWKNIPGLPVDIVSIILLFNCLVGFKTSRVFKKYLYQSINHPMSITVLFPNLLIFANVFFAQMEEEEVALYKSHEVINNEIQTIQKNLMLKP